MGADLLSRRPSSAPDWKVFDRLIEAAREMLASDAERLRTLLAESRMLLAPLQDPFDVDLGLHRWLDEEREEAYSDWLEWVVRQTTEPKQIFDLFDLPPPSTEVVQCTERGIQRECCIPHGHEDQTGRLDLVIRFGNKAIIVVEVKKEEADTADTEKHAGYNRWLADQNCPAECKHSVLIASSAEEQIYEGFRFVSWETLCLAMRRLAVDINKQSNLMAASMILAYVGAVEQNLLGFSANRVLAICEGRAAFFNPAVVNHLDRFVHTPEG
jgi:hypothetical protein